MEQIWSLKEGKKKFLNNVYWQKIKKIFYFSSVVYTDIIDG